MQARDFLEILSSHFVNPRLLAYAESEGEVRCRLAAGTSTQLQDSRSRAPLLRDLALGHRLGVWAGRDRLALPPASSFAIESMATAPTSNAVTGHCGLWLRWEVTATRRGIATEMKTLMVTEQDGETRETVILWQLVPPALVNFVRRSRQFMDFAEVAISRTQPRLAKITERHFLYYPAEADRLSDGKRVDHVPAITLIDVALSMNHGAAGEKPARSLSAKFLRYADPRAPFELLWPDDPSVIEVVQAGETVATLNHRPLNSAIEERHCPMLRR